MQDDILVKRPPVPPVSEPDTQGVKVELPEEKTIETTQAIDSVVPKNSAPVGVIAVAVFICLCLVFAAVYGALSQ